MSVTIQTPTGGPDVTRRNSREFLYLKGDENTDGSLRMLPDPVDPEKFEFQLRTSGTWNTTGIQISGATLFIGRDLSVGATAGWVKTSFRQDAVTALLPHVEFTDDGTKFPQAPILTEKATNLVLVGNDNAEVSGTFLDLAAPSASSLVLQKLWFKAGSVTATEPVLVTFRLGVGGEIFFKREIPVDIFGVPEGELIQIDLIGGIQTIPGDIIYITCESIAPFSLRINTDFFNFWYLEADGFGVVEEELVSTNLAITEELDLIFSNDLSLVVGEHVRA